MRVTGQAPTVTRVVGHGHARGWPGRYPPNVPEETTQETARAGRATSTGDGEGERLWFLGTLATVRVPGEAVDGRYSLMEILLPHHASPPLHTHPQDESMFVLEGRLTVLAGGDRFTLAAGGAVAVPMGVAHTFRVDSESARALVISTPAGIERFIRAGAVPAEERTLPPPDAPRPSPEEMERIFAANGVVNVGPPLGPDD
jgi:quercetin dioxygenase-like cupin family protein